MAVEFVSADEITLNEQSKGRRKGDKGDSPVEPHVRDWDMGSLTQWPEPGLKPGVRAKDHR